MNVEPTKLFYDEENKLYYKLIRDYENYRNYENGDIINMNNKKRRLLTVQNGKITLIKDRKCKQFKVKRITYETWYNKKLNITDVIKFLNNDKTNYHYTNLIHANDPNNLIHLPLDPNKLWKYVQDYPNYKTSNYGDIFSIHMNRLLTPALDRKGYLRSFLTNNEGSKNLQIHYIVYRSFIGAIAEDKVIDHINRIRIDNFVDNLREATYSENNKNSTRYERHGHIVHQYSYDDIFIKEWISLKNVSQTLNIDSKMIRGCCEESINEYGGFKWVYPEKVLDHSNFYTIISIDGNTYPNYKINKSSDILNLSNNMLMKYGTGTQYKTITLLDNDKNTVTEQVHRLVAMTFIPNHNGYDIVNHIDKNTMNAHVTNLEWVTQKQNVIHSRGIKINQIDIKTNKTIKTFDSVKEASDSLGKCYNSTLSMCCKGTRKTAYGYKWAYA